MSFVKNIYAFGFCLTSFLTHNVAFAGPEGLIPSPVEAVFVPLGFDDNDNIEVVVQGHFANSCYKTGPVGVTVDRQNKVVRLEPQAYEYPNNICAQVVVPFIQTVKLGMLPVGTYKIEVTNRPNVPTKDLEVRARFTDSPDDFVYAPVESADIQSGAQKIEIRGRYPLTKVGCAILKDVQVSQTPGNVVVVLPILEFLQTAPECVARQWKPTFTEVVALPAPLVAGDYLLHVRVLNGNSYNKFESLSAN